MEKFILVKNKPSVEDYMHLRKNTLGEKSYEHSCQALNSTWYSVYVIYNNKTIGLGRIIGDGAISFVLTDVCVLEEYRNKGVGTLIMEALIDYYKKNAPKDSFFILMAKGNAKFLYKKFGFKEENSYTGMLFKS